MATLTKKVVKYMESTHCKRSMQGAGAGTKTGRTKGSLKKYRGQGGRRKSVKR